MNKIFNKFLVGLLFVLGVVLFPTYKVDAAITVTVKADGQTSKTISSGEKVTISWESTGATSCDSGGHGTATSGSFLTDPLTATTTFTVTCTKPAYCSGNFNCSSIGDYDSCNFLSGSGCMLQATSCSESEGCWGGTQPCYGQCSCNYNSDCSSGFCNTDTYLCEVCGPSDTEGPPNCSVFNDDEGSACQSVGGCTWNP